MRQIKLICVWCLFILGMSSCNNSPTIIQGAQWKIADCKVDTFGSDTGWQYTYYTDYRPSMYNNNYYYVKYYIPDLSEFVFMDGNVQCYLIEDIGYNEKMQRQLPFTRHKEIIDHDTVVGYYTETYDCVYGVGWVEFNYIASDFAYEGSLGKQKITQPNPCTFRVVMTW